MGGGPIKSFPADSSSSILLFLAIEHDCTCTSLGDAAVAFHFIKCIKRLAVSNGEQPKVLSCSADADKAKGTCGHAAYCVTCDESKAMFHKHPDLLS